MTRAFLRLAALSLLLPAGTALAQGGPAPGTADSTKVTSSRQQEDASYNRLIGATHRKGGGKTVVAAASDVLPGLEVADKKGMVLGLIESVDAASAIIVSATGRVSVPRDVFGKNRHGLVLDILKPEFDAQVAAANAAAPKG